MVRIIIIHNSVLTLNVYFLLPNQCKRDKLDEQTKSTFSLSSVESRVKERIWLAGAEPEFTVNVSENSLVWNLQLDEHCVNIL